MNGWDKKKERFALNLARAKAKSLKGKYGILLKDVRDIEQELLLALLEKSANYNPEKASFYSFAVLVMDNAFADRSKCNLWPRR